MPKSAIIAGLIGFFIGIVTNITAALLTGGSLFLITWALSGFRFEGSAKPAPTASILEKVPEIKNDHLFDISSLSPYQLGGLICNVLSSSCKIDSISSAEKDLLMAANILEKKYFDELLALSAFSQDYAIFRLLGHSEVGVKILAGYRDAWEKIGKSGPDGLNIYELFVSRCPNYAVAVKEDDDAAREGTLPIRGLAFSFAEAIQPEGSTSGQIGSGILLASIRANAQYISHSESTAKILKDAKLIE